MRKIYLLSVVALMFFNMAAAQNGKPQIDFRFDKEAATPATMEFSAKGLSPRTAFLLMDIKIAKEKNAESKLKVLSEDELIKKYDLIRQNSTLYANAFISVSENCTEGALEKMGIIVNNSTQNFHTVLLPIE